MAKRSYPRQMEASEIPAFVDEVIEIGCGICAIGHDGYVIGDADLTAEKYEVAGPQLTRIDEKYGDRDPLRLEIAAYLRSLGRYIDPGSHVRHWSENQTEETADLLETLRQAMEIISTSDADAKRRILEAYQDACSTIALIEKENGSARPRIVSCLERFNTLKAAGDITCTGWLLAAMEERIAECDLPYWHKLKRLAAITIQALSLSQKTILH